MTNKLVADVASYQSSTLGFFKKLRAKGVVAVMVKITDDNDYLNPLAGAQVTNAFKSGMKSVGLYHYFHGKPYEEAQYFLKWVKAFGMDKDTPLAIDVEDKSLPYYNTHLVNLFLGELKKAGYTCRVVYGSASWFNSQRLKYHLLADKNIWVASYGTTMPGVDHANAWQYTDNFKGMHVDASLDFDGTLSGSRKAKPKAKPKPKPKNTYVNSGNRFKVVTEVVHLYNSAIFEDENDTGLLYKQGSIFDGTPVKYGNIWRLKLADGNWVTANDKYINKV